MAAPDLLHRLTQNQNVLKKKEFFIRQSTDSRKERITSRSAYKHVEMKAAVKQADGEKL